MKSRVTVSGAVLAAALCACGGPSSSGSSGPPDVAADGPTGSRGGGLVGEYRGALTVVGATSATLTDPQATVSVQSRAEGGVMITIDGTTAPGDFRWQCALRASADGVVAAGQSCQESSTRGGVTTSGMVRVDDGTAMGDGTTLTVRLNFDESEVMRPFNLRFQGPRQ